MLSGEGLYLSPEALPIFSMTLGDGIGKPRCSVMKGHDLPTHLQVRHISVEQEAVHTAHLELHMTVEDLVDVDDPGRHARRDSARGAGFARPTTSLVTELRWRRPGGAGPLPLGAC